MKKSSNLNGEFEYVLLDNNQQDIDLRKKIADLYSTPFADIQWCELYDPSLVNHGYYKLFYYEQSVLKHIILFKYSSKAPTKIFVLNQQIHISLKDVENISHILFNEFNKVQQIIFEKIFEPDEKQSPKMILEWTPINDVIILDMAHSMDDYLSSLGKRTRKKIKMMLICITNDCPDIQVHHYEKTNISLELIRKIVSLNRCRMKNKGIISDLNDTECNILHQYATASGYGSVCTCEINGKIISAAVSSVIGKHAYLHVLTHDESYNRYSLGQVTLAHTTKYMIEERKIKDLHLLCGTQEYKFRHGGVNHVLYNCLVFRKKNIYYSIGKIMSFFRESFWKIRRRLKEDKTVFRFFVQLNKIKMKICGI